MKPSEDNIDEEEVEEEEIFCHPYMNLMDESKITHVSTFLNSQPLSPSYMWHPSAENSEEEIEDVDEFFARATAELEESIEASIAAIKKEMKSSESVAKDPNDDSGLSDSSRVSCSTTELNESEAEKSEGKSEATIAGNPHTSKVTEVQGNCLKGHDHTDSGFPEKQAFRILDEALMEADGQTLCNGQCTRFSDSDEETSNEDTLKNTRVLIRQTSGKEEHRKGVSSLIYEFQQQINSSKEVNNLPSRVSTKNSQSICCNSNEFAKCCSHNNINSNLQNHHSSSQNILTSPDIAKANAKIPNKNVWGKIQNFEAVFQKEMYDNCGAETDDATLKLPNVNLLTDESCYRKANLNDFKNKLNDILSMNGKTNVKNNVNTETFRDDEDVGSYSSNENGLIDLPEEETSAETKVSEVFDRLNMIPRSYYLSDVLEDEEKLPNLSIETPEKLLTLLNSRLLSFSFYLRNRDNDLMTYNQNQELDNMIKSSCFAFQNSEEGVDMVKDLLLSSLCGFLDKNTEEEMLVDEKCGDIRRNNDLERSWLQSIPRACFDNESDFSNTCPSFTLDIFNLKLMSKVFKTCWTRKESVDETKDSQSPSENEIFELESDCNIEKSDNLVKNASVD